MKKIRIGKKKYTIVHTLRGKYVRCPRDHLTRWGNLVLKERKKANLFGLFYPDSKDVSETPVCNFCGYNFKTGEYMTDKKYPFPPPKDE